METVKTKLETFLYDKFKVHFKKWMQEDVSKTWRENFKILPTLLMKVRNHMISTTFKSYFEQLRQVEGIGNMSCTADLADIQDLLKYNESTANLTVIEKGFITENISLITLEVQNQMDNFLKYKDWSKDEIETNIKQEKNKKEQKNSNNFNEEDTIRKREEKVKEREENLQNEEYRAMERKKNLKNEEQKVKQIKDKLLNEE